MKQECISLFIYGIRSGKHFGTWTGYTDEMPTLFQIWDMLCLAVPFVVVNEDGTLWGTFQELK